MDLTARVEIGAPTNSDNLLAAGNVVENYRSIRRKIIYCAIALTFPVVVPFIHISIFSHLWREFNRVVDKNLCSCSCWDTVFKGNYETGISAYKHIYFNATLNTFKIWFSTVLAVILFYESIRYLARLIYESRIRKLMLILFAASIYPHYYSWWSYFNYLNDEFYSQWYHQTYFTLTEMSSTLAVLWLADSKSPASMLALLVILDVAVAHIIISGFDQLVSNVLLGDGRLHQVLRDVGMFLPDFLHAFVALREMRLVGRLKRIPATHLISNRQFLASILFMILSWILCFML